MLPKCSPFAAPGACCFAGKGTWCLPGDVDGDDVVDAADLVLLMESWAEDVDGDDRWDVDRDLRTNVQDLLTLLNAWGETF